MRCLDLPVGLAALGERISFQLLMLMGSEPQKDEGYCLALPGAQAGDGFPYEGCV